MAFLAKYILMMIHTALSMYMFLMFIYILASWFVQRRDAGWFVFMEELCEPTLRWIRRITKDRMRIEQFDLSPLLLWVFIYIAQYIISSLLSYM